MTYNNNTYRNVTITSLIAAILITSGIGVAYAADNEFTGTSEFGSPSTNVASGINSAAFGAFTTASGKWSTAFGYETEANGENSAAFGQYTEAQPQASFVIVAYNEVSGTTHDWIATDPLFVIGNGADANNKNNAVTVLKNGNVGIGESNPGQPLVVTGIINSTSGGFVFPDGTTQTTANVDNSITNEIEIGVPYQEFQQILQMETMIHN